MKSDDRENQTEWMNRRQFLLLAAAAAATVNPGSVSTSEAAEGKLIDAGPLTNYSAEGVYDHFRDLGFFVIRKGDKLTALSLNLYPPEMHSESGARSFFLLQMPRVDLRPVGKVTEGPANRDLPTFSTTNEKGHLLVKVPAG